MTTGRESPFSFSRQQFLDACRQGIEYHQREADKLRELADRAANPPAGVKVTFGVRPFHGYTVRFTEEIEA